MRGHAADRSGGDQIATVAADRDRGAARHAVMRDAVRNGAAASRRVVGGDGTGSSRHRRVSAADDGVVERDLEARPAGAGRAGAVLLAVDVAFARLHFELGVLQGHRDLLVALRSLVALRVVADEVVAVVRLLDVLYRRREADRVAEVLAVRVLRDELQRLV